MSYHHSKKTIAFGLIIATLAVSLSAYKATDQHPSQSGWKNLNVLPQNITRDSLHQLMDGYNTALGVKCGFCHAKDSATNRMNFASDDKKEKGFARHMITMTQKINANDFNFHNSARPDTINIVSCGTCHRGKAEPETFAGKE